MVRSPFIYFHISVLLVMPRSVSLIENCFIREMRFLLGLDSFMLDVGVNRIEPSLVNAEIASPKKSRMVTLSRKPIICLVPPYSFSFRVQYSSIPRSGSLIERCFIRGIWFLLLLDVGVGVNCIEPSPILCGDWITVDVALAPMLDSRSSSS
jgi:hypothetical protein